MARKLGASESYQQLAENAAMNGFNRIMGRAQQPQWQSIPGYLYDTDNTTMVPILQTQTMTNGLG